jgi:hypothetical protein
MLRQTPGKVREKQETELGQENLNVLSYFEINYSCSWLGEPELGQLFSIDMVEEKCSD